MQMTLEDARSVDRRWKRWLVSLDLQPGQFLPAAGESLLGLLAEAEGMPATAAVIATAADLLHRVLGDEVPAQGRYFALATLSLAMALQLDRALAGQAAVDGRARISQTLALDRALEQAEAVLARLWHTPAAHWSRPGAWPRLIREATAAVWPGPDRESGQGLRAA